MQAGTMEFAECRVQTETWDRATLDTDHKRDPSHLLLHTNGAAAVESSSVTKFMKRPFAPLNAGNIGTTGHR
jgi:hypothetical protein